MEKLVCPKCKKESWERSFKDGICSSCNRANQDNLLEMEKAFNRLSLLFTGYILAHKDIETQAVIAKQETYFHNALDKMTNNSKHFPKIELD